MKTRYAGVLAIACLQVCPTTSLSDESSVQTVEITTDSTCQFYVSPQAPDAQHIRAYKWEDVDGNDYYDDSIPERVEIELRVAEELQRRADRALLQTYMQQPDGRAFARGDRCAELFSAQSRMTKLYIENLQRRLARLEAAADTSEVDESLLQEIRNTKEAIVGHQENLKRYRNGEEENRMGR